MSLQRMIEETRHMLRSQVAELVDQLTLELYQRAGRGTDESWRQEVKMRMADIMDGKVQGIPEKTVSAQTKQLFI